MNRKLPLPARKILNQILMKPLIILDAGHRQSTPGKKWTFAEGTKFEEWEFNQDILERVALTLELNDVLFDYMDNDFKDIPLTERVEWANQFDNAFQISIHSNADVKESNASGNEIWIYENASEKSRKIAQIMKEEMIKAFPDMKFRGIKESKFTINSVKHPSILTENGFYTNYNEVTQILNTEAGRQKIVDYHVNAILRVLDEVY